MSKKPIPQPKAPVGKQPPDTPQFVECPSTRLYSEAALNAPVIRLGPGQPVRVADRLRDVLPPEHPQAANRQPGPPAAG